MNSEAIAGP